MSTQTLLYGANGYSGEKLLRELRLRGVPVRAAGRSKTRVAGVAALYDCPHSVFVLDDQAAVDEEIRKSRLVINAAGPFTQTAPLLMAACIRQGRDYLDISGEIDTFRLAEQLDADAKRAGCMLLPGVGFDVVPSDALAVHLKRSLPGATTLELGIAGLWGPSRGSALTMCENLGRPAVIRKDGEIVSVQGLERHWTDFGLGPRLAITATWGDVVTAHRSTGIPNIRVSFAATPLIVGSLGTNQLAGELLDSPAPRAWLRRMAARLPAEPTTPGGRAVIAGEVTDGTRRVRARVYTPEVYSFTAACAAAVTEAVLANQRANGFQTPASLLTDRFAFGLPGVQLEHIE